MNKEIKWISISKGFLMILVVAGHSNYEILSRYIYWFHMPAFILISGYLFNNVYNLKDLISKRSKRMLIPYFSFALLTLIIIQIQSYNLNEMPLYIENIIMGGRRLLYFYGIYWFPTMILLTTIIFAIMINAIKNRIATIGVIVLLYIVAHLYVANNDYKVFWSADTVLITLFYFGLGYYGKSIVNRINTLYGIVAMLIGVILIYCDYVGMIQYKLDMKSNVYNHLTLDALIPVVFTVIIISISKLIQNTYVGSLLSSIGKMSMTIMYLHLTVMIIMRNYFNVSEWITILIAIVIPVAAHLIFERISLFNVLFLGKQHKIKYKGESRSV
ncbi:acyltransferase family protein [Priestia aryabhattai]|uniref:acyltransferase family protein n=1 Tax=Priestia aryabhattai TaxID=412384 RepID=UPI0015F4DCE1|nr:acyltransferase family protein [Priestia aryabhattai]